MKRFFFLDSRYTNTRFADQEDFEYRFIFVVCNNNPMDYLHTMQFAYFFL